MKLKKLITVATTAYTVTLPVLSHGAVIITDDFSVNQVGATTAGETIKPQYSITTRSGRSTAERSPPTVPALETFCQQLAI